MPHLPTFEGSVNLGELILPAGSGVLLVLNWRLPLFLGKPASKNSKFFDFVSEVILLF